ncbi:S1 family peptidase [Herbidospora solisilvae]|uniref:S1 family peptidase n=1 Tax=Herbidospora solisilvae TaxID=2696284 RepID=UPI00192A0116|nr:serine protease [Herbidospora solisilvae]
MIAKLAVVLAVLATAGCAQGAADTRLATPQASKPAGAAEWPNVVRFVAEAPSCRKRMEGTGFAYAPERVMTTAHAVAGSIDPITVIGSDGRSHEGTVVVFDPDRDVAVLRVPGLSARPLEFAPAEDGDAFTFAGYRKGGHFTERPGKIDVATEASSNDIYHQHEVFRQVFIILAKVEPGLAGAPMVRSDGTVAGMIFAADTGNPFKGYALSTKELGRPAKKGRTATEAVSTRECD